MGYPPGGDDHCDEDYDYYDDGDDDYMYYGLPPGGDDHCDHDYDYHDSDDDGDDNYM